MNNNYNIKHFILFFCVSLALLLLTDSWLMTLGILMLLLLIDRLLINYDNKRRYRQNQDNENEKDKDTQLD